MQEQKLQFFTIENLLQASRLAISAQNFITEYEKLILRESEVNTRFQETEAFRVNMEFINQQLHWFQKFEQTKKLIYTDDVTGLYNQRFLKVALKQETDRYSRYHQPFSLLFIDVDNFKYINDTFGHLTGSSTLTQLGRFLKTQIRNMDLLFRYGGDEFIIILIGAVAAEARSIANRLCKKIEQTTFQTHCQRQLKITASIGVASVPEHAQDPVSLLKFADKSMYYSKESGKNQVTVFSPEHFDGMRHDQGSKTETT